MAGVVGCVWKLKHEEHHDSDRDPKDPSVFHGVSIPVVERIDSRLFYCWPWPVIGRAGLTLLKRPRRGGTAGLTSRRVL
jgi:hypothetical protein